MNKKSEGAKFFWILLRKNHNPPLQNVLYLAEWGCGLLLSQFQICPYPPPPPLLGIYIIIFKTFGQIPHPPATLQKLSHSSNPLNILLNAAEMSEVSESCLTDVFFYFKKIVYSRKPTLNGLFQRLSNASTKQ